MSELLGRLAYESAVDALKQQDAMLNELRSRTGIVLAADSITASFLGAAGLKGGSVGIVGTTALLSFMLCLSASAYILLPRRGMCFSITGPVVYTGLYEHRENPEEMYRRLAYWLEVFWAANQSVIEKLHPFFKAAVALLIMQLLLWALDLTVTL